MFEYFFHILNLCTRKKHLYGKNGQRLNNFILLFKIKNLNINVVQAKRACKLYSYVINTITKSLTQLNTFKMCSFKHTETCFIHKSTPVLRVQVWVGQHKHIVGSQSQYHCSILLPDVWPSTHSTAAALLHCQQGVLWKILHCQCSKESLKSLCTHDHSTQNLKTREKWCHYWSWCINSWCSMF